MKKNCGIDILVLLTALFMGAAACQKVIPEDVPDDFISNVYNPNSEKHVSYRGATITVKFDAAEAWHVYLVKKYAPDTDWVAVSPSTLSGNAKKGCSVRVEFMENKTEHERTVELWAASDGHDDMCIASMTQDPSGTSSSAKINRALNTYMHDILKEDYLFKDAYNAQEVDLDVNFNEYLGVHLISDAIGDANIEDGGYYKTHQPQSGQRYIYTSLTEVQLLKSGMRATSSMAAGLGFGPFLSTALSDSDNPMMGITPGYVRKGSPADLAGLRRGDIIYEVNGEALNVNNYEGYMMSLYQTGSGEYRFTYLRHENGQFQSYESGNVMAGVYAYNPVLHWEIIDGTVGYLVYESFDLYSHDILKDVINEFKTRGIDELILDLSFNTGGAVAQSRWLSGCIAGSSNGNRTFAKAVYADGFTEDWKFNYGYDNDTDNLGLPIDLGLSRVYVICSYNTASAAELVISSLRGIDFNVLTIGSSRTEGKNVGMTVSETSVGGRKFQFAPVTFRLHNAKGWSGYADGMIPDVIINNDNGVLTDDYDYLFPYSFADWGNQEYVSAFELALMDIRGGDRKCPAQRCRLTPVSDQRLRLEHGRYGNLVYSNN